jgi:hypothetical protein
MKKTLLITFAVLILLIVTFFYLVSCSGSGGGDNGGDEETPPSIGTGADNVTIFWLHYGPGFGGGQSVQQTSDGGFIAAGSMASDISLPSDRYVLKTDAQGAVQWQKTFGGPGRDAARSVQQTSDGGYLIAGCVDCDTAPNSFSLLKLDNSGNTTWDRTIPGSSLDGAYAARETRSGTVPVADGFVLVGSDTNQGIALIKTDLTGSTTWQQSFASHSGWDVGFDVEQTTDNGYVIAGYYGTEIGLIKTDPDGNLVWEKRFGTGVALSVKQTAEGGYVLAGRTTLSSSFGGTVPGDVVVIKSDKDGNEVWRKTFGGSEDDGAYSIALTLDGGYIVAGTTRSYSPGSVDSAAPWQWEDVYLIKLDANGNTSWQKVKGHLPNSSDGGASVSAVSDGGYIVTGNSNAYEDGTLLLMKTDKNGDTVDLGDQDLTITIPSTSGIINFTNAIDVASAGVKGFTLPHDVGTATLDILIDVATGATASNFCNLGGSYSATLIPPGPVAGSVLSVTLNNCIKGTMGDNGTLNGTFTLTVDSMTGGFSSDYAVQTTVNPISITTVESGGSLTTLLTGGTRFQRQSVTNSFTERSDSITSPTAATLTVSETEGGITSTRVVGPFSLGDTVSSSGAYSYGKAGETSVVDPGTTSGALTVTMLEPVQGATLGDAPSIGSFRISAQDNSRMTATATTTGIGLAIDTNADGNDDGTLSTSWDYLY